jgi:hypothetical protein
VRKASRKPATGGSVSHCSDMPTKDASLLLLLLLLIRTEAATRNTGCWANPNPNPNPNPDGFATGVFTERIGSPAAAMFT